jgi:hypothetical protein
MTVKELMLYLGKYDENSRVMIDQGEDDLELRGLLYNETNDTVDLYP